MDNDSGIRSLDRAFGVLECFVTREELSLVEIAGLTGLSTSTAYRIISALDRINYLSRNANTKKYSLGPKFILFGHSSVFNPDDSLRRLGLRHLSGLRDRYGLTSALYVLRERNRVCIERVSGRDELFHRVSVGDILPLTRGAAGLVLLAHLGSGELDNLTLADTPSEISLSVIRDTGYAIALADRIEGIGSIASPVFDAVGRCVASMMVSGFVNGTLTEKRDLIVADLKNTALQLSTELGHNPKK